MDSFRLRVEFLCKKDSVLGEQWEKITMPKWVQQVIESKDMDKIQGLCFNVDAHISTMKKFYKKFGSCDPERLMHFFKASMHHFHEFCIKGRGFDKCLGELFGEDGMSGAIGKCAVKEGLNPMMQKPEDCGPILKKVETCVGGSDVCKDDKGALLVKFKKGMHERIDKIMEKSNKDRHVESCKMMAKMFKAKMAKKMQDNQE